MGQSKTFHLVLIKPSHYDDDGYVIQWDESRMPSNTLAVLYGLAVDVASHRLLGEDVSIEVCAYDETSTVIPVEEIIRKIRDGGRCGLVALAGVQSNEFPRAIDLGTQFREAEIDVAIGGFHVSGCLSMLPEMPLELREAMDRGLTLFAGEAEGRLGGLLRDAYEGRLEPLYNYMDDLPSLEGAPGPYLPRDLVERTSGARTTFDCGRGCPFRCSFCTIINVQGRKSRFRSPDDIEAIVRANHAQGLVRYFITDDNFVRNKIWEAILDRLITLRHQDGIELSLTVQVDTVCHRIPSFIEKCAEAGCDLVFIGLESINPDSLTGAKKGQNRIWEYRKMLQAWRRHGVMTAAGYILGFPTDTPESIARDIAIIQRELPLDFLEFFTLTPLPGSEDHLRLHEQGVWMDPDMNKYDTKHVTTAHPLMSAAQWEQVYRAAWHQYYSPEHVRTLIKRAIASGLDPNAVTNILYAFYSSFAIEGVHPLEGGIRRRKARTQRRSTHPLENPFLFYPRRLWEIVSARIRHRLLLREFMRICRDARIDPDTATYTDLALSPVFEGEEEKLELVKVFGRRPPSGRRLALEGGL